MKFNDQVVSAKDFEAFCDTHFNVAPSAKPIDARKSVLQELGRLLKQIDESANIFYCALKLERAQDSYVAPPDVSISDAESVPKFLTKISKFFLSVQAKKGKNL